MSRSNVRPVVFVGAMTLDAIALVDRFPGPDERQVAREVAYAGGGPAATAAVAASRLGVPSAVVGVVGDDEEGERIVAALRAERVDVSAVQVAPGRRSGSSVVVVDAGSGSRAICTRPVPDLEIPADGPGTQLLSQAHWVHVDHLGWPPVRTWLGERGRAETPRLSVDAGNPIHGFSAAGVDLYVPTAEALTREYGDKPIDEQLAAAIAAGAATVVATRGGDGCVAATADGARYHAAGHSVEVVSTLGAGDVFHGALLAAVVRGMGLQDCMSYANVAAGLSCRGLDGRSAIPTHDHVLAAMRAVDNPLIPTPSS